MKNSFQSRLVNLISLIALLPTFSNAAELKNKRQQEVINIAREHVKEHYFPDKGLVVGQVYEEVEYGRWGSFKIGLPGIMVYVDENDNGKRDNDERYTHTYFDGYYWFAGLPEGEHIIRQELPFGYSDTPALSESQTPSDERASPQIIGGDTVNPGEYPFMVSLDIYGIPGSYNHGCGGTLITDRFVVTAAHCSEAAKPGEVFVLAGTENITDGSGLRVGVKSVSLHPAYIIPTVETPADTIPGVSGGYDIAVWELEKPIDLEATGLETISMLSKYEGYLEEPGVLATAVGWGTSNRPEVDLLQDVHLPIYDNEACNEVYSDTNNFNTMICGGIEQGGIDACQGDSGGPLLVRDDYWSQWRLAGVTSFGFGCAVPKNPGVWARVSELSDWVMSAATESSKGQTVTVTVGRATFVNIENRSTLRERSSDIDYRWQLGNLTVEEQSDGVEYSWSIIDESPFQRFFSCNLDVNIFGDLEYNEQCPAGDSSFLLRKDISGESDIYASTLSVNLEDSDFSRNIFFSFGELSAYSILGDLDAEVDEIDPDVLNDITYYIDWYEVKDLSLLKNIAIKLESLGMEDLFLIIYDLEERKGSKNGIIDYDSGFGKDASIEMFLKPEEGRRYAVGVSSYSQNIEGEYKVSVLNDGELIELDNLPNSAQINIQTKLQYQKIRDQIKRTASALTSTP